jgi:hypothetical protein
VACSLHAIRPKGSAKQMASKKLILWQHLAVLLQG